MLHETVEDLEAAFDERKTDIMDSMHKGLSAYLHSLLPEY